MWLLSAANLLAHKLSLCITETEEGFIKLFSKKANDWPEQNTPQQEVEQVEEEEAIDPDIPVISNLRHLLKVSVASAFPSIYQTMYSHAFC